MEHGSPARLAYVPNRASCRVPNADVYQKFEIISVRISIKIRSISYSAVFLTRKIKEK
jgi:hypothetical protein